MSFEGMRIEYGLLAGESFKDVEVDYRGSSVFHADRLGGPFAARITAPGTSGDVCIARMAGYHEPVALLYSGWFAEGASILEVVYPAPAGRYATTGLGFPGALGFDIRLLGGSLVMVAGDPRFSFLFTDGAGSNAPVRILRFESGHTVDVSTRFPSLIAADAARLVRTTRFPVTWGRRVRRHTCVCRAISRRGTSPTGHASA